MTRIEWAKEYCNLLRTELINAGYYTNVKEANRGVVLHEDLHGQGPAIVYDGDFEILGLEIMLHTTVGSNFLTLPKMNTDFFAEPENSECVRIYEV